MQKAGASIYLGVMKATQFGNPTAKELLVSTNAIVVCVRGENSVCVGLGGKLKERVLS